MSAVQCSADFSLLVGVCFEILRSSTVTHNDEAPSELAQAMMDYLDCPCTFFGPASDDSRLMKAWQETCKRGAVEGFVPVIVTVDDTLFEMMLLNTDADKDVPDNSNNLSFNSDMVRQYRQRMLDGSLPDGRQVLNDMIDTRRSEADDDEINWENEVIGEPGRSWANDSFESYGDYEDGSQCPVILACIPVKNPWEVFAWIPMGNWNECPDTPELMAVARYWYEQHQAVPATMSHDVLEFTVPAAPDAEKARNLALEQYSFCPDIVDQSAPGMNVASLAEVLKKSSVWYFWWD